MTKNSKKKVVMIGLKGLPAKGGAATVGQNIIEQLKNDYDYTVLSVASHTDKKSELFAGFKQIVFPSFGKGGLNTFIYYCNCAVYCIFHKFDLVHLHHAESGFIIRLLQLKTKVVVTFHGVFLNEDPKFSKLQNRFFRFSERLNVKYANEVVSVSEPDCKYIEEKYGRTISFIPNNINLCTENLSTNLANEPYIFFAAGRIYEIKGLHLLLKAMQKMGIKNKLIVAGDLDQVPSYKAEILDLAKTLPVEFIGHINSKTTLLAYAAHAQLFIFPSLTEAMSIMLLEAVSTKVPVIASDIAANTAIFSNEELLFFQSNNSSDLGQKLELALRDLPGMKQRAEKAYLRLIKNYTGEIVGAKYKSIYNRLTN